MSNLEENDEFSDEIINPATDDTENVDNENIADNENEIDEDSEFDVDEYTVDIIERFIRSGKMHTHELREPDRPKRPGAHWILFHAVYLTKDTTVVPNYYFCPVCHDLMYIKKGNGTNTLTRHICYKIREAELKKMDKEEGKKKRMNVVKIEPRVPSKVVARKPVNETVVNPISTAHRSILMRGFIAYGKICSSYGDLSAENLEAILPKEWTTSKW